MMGNLFLLLGVTSINRALGIVYGELDSSRDYLTVGMLVGVYENPSDYCDKPPCYRYRCTGTLLQGKTGDGVFLTAAHCFDLSDPPTHWAAKMDSDIYHQAVDVAIPNQWDGNFGNTFLRYDMGVLVLEGNELTETYGFADLPPMWFLDDWSVQDLKSLVFRVVGFGDTRDIRKEGWNGIVSDDLKRRVASQKAIRINESTLLLHMRENKDIGGTCYGDSGGPHFVFDNGYTSVSTTSTGDVNCKATDMTVRMDTMEACDFLSGY